MVEIEDHALVERILAGDQEAFRRLVEKYRTYVFQLVYSVLRHPKDAEDMTQDVFVKMYLSLPSYNRQGFKTWLSRMAVNKAIDLKRKMQRKKEELADQVDQDGSRSLAVHAGNEVENTVLKREMSERIATRLREIPANYREVVQAYYIEEKTYQEIAREQGIAVKSVETKLYRAKRWIRKHWKEEDFR